MTQSLRIAKVGGSLFDLPDLRARLRAWMEGQTRQRFLLVPGGGDLADAIRRLQSVHRFGDPAAHWMGIRTMTVQAHVLGVVLDAPVVTTVGNDPVAVFDVWPFLTADEGRAGALEHSWNVTSDSIAARIARRVGTPLTLLKSTDRPDGISWREAADRGLVDAAFPAAAAGLDVEWVNLRAR
jgi:5-(aminomethyl)-3-furanmethanol phosphate kinase